MIHINDVFAFARAVTNPDTLNALIGECTNRLAQLGYAPKLQAFGAGMSDRAGSPQVVSVAPAAGINSPVGVPGNPGVPAAVPIAGRQDFVQPVPVDQPGVPVIPSVTPQMAGAIRDRQTAVRNAGAFAHTSPMSAQAQTQVPNATGREGWPTGDPDRSLYADPPPAPAGASQSQQPQPLHPPAGPQQYESPVDRANREAAEAREREPKIESVLSDGRNYSTQGRGVKHEAPAPAPAAAGGADIRTESNVSAPAVEAARRQQDEQSRSQSQQPKSDAPEAKQAQTAENAGQEDDQEQPKAPAKGDEDAGAKPPHRPPPPKAHGRK